MSNGKITKQPTTDLAYLEEKDTNMMGTEEIKREDLVIPRLKIVQPTTKQKHGVEDGNLIHSITGKNYGKSINMVCIVHWKSNIKFDGGALLCRSMDSIVSQDGKKCAECGEAEFGEGGAKPTCGRTFNYLVGEEQEMKEALNSQSAIPPMLMFFGGIATKIGRLINTSIQLNATRKFPIYSQYFTLTVPAEPKEFDVGKAFIPEIKIGRYVRKEDELPFLKAAFTELSKLKIEVGTKDDADETTPQNDAV